jgi:hypothetical protein
MATSQIVAQLLEIGCNAQEAGCQDVTLKVAAVLVYMHWDGIFVTWIQNRVGLREGVFEIESPDEDSERVFTVSDRAIRVVTRCSARMDQLRYELPKAHPDFDPAEWRKSFLDELHELVTEAEITEACAVVLIK